MTALLYFFPVEGETTVLEELYWNTGRAADGTAALTLAVLNICVTVFLVIRWQSRVPGD